MQQRKSGARRQHAEDKPIIDHLTAGPLKSTPRKNRRGQYKFNEDDGRELAEAIQKRWTAEKGGGLPDF